MDYKQQIDNIIDISDKIQTGQVTILTGKNGSGKSLVRKLVGYLIAEKLGLDKTKPIVASTSIQQRTELRSDFGAFSSIMHDDPTSPTSLETFNKIKQLLKICSTDSKRFLVIDEPEIGMGEELVVALVNWLNIIFNPIPDNCHGILVITHNRYIVENLKGSFLNLEKMTKKEWLNRKIVPIVIEEFEKDSIGLFRAIQQKLKDKNA